MNSRLERVTDWVSVSRNARYHVASLATLCSVSRRELERFFHERFRLTTRAFPPFNNYVTYIAGDSGAPLMWPATDGTLVFLGGDTTSPASSQMQNDMNTLCQWQGLDYTQTRYQMQQHPLQ